MFFHSYLKFTISNKTRGFLNAFKKNTDDSSNFNKNRIIF